jgi:hypothetical protein
LKKDLHKKCWYEQTVWIKDDDPKDRVLAKHRVLDVISTSRAYYPKARWAKTSSFCTCPCEPKCHQSYQEFKSFSNNAWSLDNEDFCKTYYNKNIKSM